MLKKYTIALLFTCIATTHANFKDFSERMKEKTEKQTEKFRLAAEKFGHKAFSKTKNFFKSAKEYTTKKIQKMMNRINNINSLDSDGNTILMSVLASQKNKSEDELVHLTTVFIERSGDLTIKNKNDETALDIAHKRSLEKVAHTIEQKLIQDGLAK